MIRVRFAPSPTGYIHIGNTRIALFNWLFSLQQNGEFILRYDDTDAERSKAEYVERIAEDLDWLGIRPDEVYFQSVRFDRYHLIVEKLKESGLLYACYETSEELERRRRIRLSRKLPPVYGREALKLSAQEKQAFVKEGRMPHWRFLLPNFSNNPFETERSEISWDDAVRGRQTVDLASVSDPVLIRADGSFLYTLPSVIDDMDMGITHVIRGADHLTNTGVQIALFQALKIKDVPVFCHINLLASSSGERFSKRKGDLSVRNLRETGFEPMSVVSLVTLTGTAGNIEPYNNIIELAEHFRFDSASKSTAKFNPEELVRLNRHLVHNLAFTEVSGRLSAMGITGDKAEPFWLAVCGNLDTLADSAEWWKIITDESLSFLHSAHTDGPFLCQAANFLPPEPWDYKTWRQWTRRLKMETGRSGKLLFKPLRYALTGQESGPDLAELLPLIDRHIVLRRLQVS